MLSRELNGTNVEKCTEQRSSRPSKTQLRKIYMVTKQCPALWASLSCWGEIWSPCHSPPLSQKSPGNPGKRMKYIKDDSIDRSLGKMIAAGTCLTHGGSRGQLRGTSPASFCSSSKLPSPPRRAVAELWIPPRSPAAHRHVFPTTTLTWARMCAAPRPVAARGSVGNILQLLHPGGNSRPCCPDIQ